MLCRAEWRRGWRRTVGGGARWRRHYVALLARPPLEACCSGAGSMVVTNEEGGRRRLPDAWTSCLATSLRCDMCGLAMGRVLRGGGPTLKDRQQLLGVRLRPAQVQGRVAGLVLGTWVCPRVHEHPCQLHARRAVLHNQVERRVVHAIRRVGGRPRVEQQLRGKPAPEPSRVVEGGAFHFVTRVNTAGGGRAAGQQLLHCRTAALRSCGAVQWRPQFVVGQRGAGTTLEEGLHGTAVATASRNVEWGATTLQVTSAHVGTQRHGQSQSQC